MYKKVLHKDFIGPTHKLNDVQSKYTVGEKGLLGPTRYDDRMIQKKVQRHSVVRSSDYSSRNESHLYLGKIGLLCNSMHKK